MAFSIRKVLISEPVDPICGKILQDNGVDVTTKTGLTKDQLLEEVKNYDGLVVRSATKVTADIIKAAKELKVIGRAGTGVDNIDCNAATRHGVLVLNAPGGNTLSAAELTCAMVITLSRNVPQACASLKSGKWDRKSFMGQELQGKTLAIIGLGRIGREVASRMQAFGMTTIGFDPLVPPEVSKTFDVESFDLEHLWPQADYITVHTPLIPQTKNLVNEAVFAKCRKGVKIVNCARGGIIDEDALLKALESGQCGGAGLDVFVEEPSNNTALIQHPKVVCTPHLGASTKEAQNRVAEEIAQQILDLLQGRFVPGIVNSPAFCSVLMESNRPWVSLCQTLGKIAALLVPATATDIAVRVTTHGCVLDKKVDFLSIATVVGLLKQRSQNGINFINAPLLAQEAGYKVEKNHVSTELKGPSYDLNSAVTVAVSGAGVNHTVVGSVEGNLILLSSIDDSVFSPPIPINGNAVLCHGRHSPQMMMETISAVASVGTVTSAAWSVPVNDHSWCFVGSNAVVPQLPSSLAPLLDFWAQLTV